MKGNELVLRWLRCTLFSLLVILVSVVHAGSLKAEDRTSSNVTSVDIKDTDSLQQATNLSAAFRKATEMVRPAVVNIRADQQTYFGALSAKPILSDPWQRYLDYALSQVDAFKQTPSPVVGPEPIPKHSATGVIVSPEGYVLTSCDVVAGANQFIVKTQTNIEYPAKVARKDPKAGLAVLKIDAHDLPFARFANLDAARVGDWVLAIGGSSGNPVSAGIISSINKDALNRSEQSNCLHTDALISPANHGGPLVNLQGEVIGINVFKATHAGELREFGVAVPGNLAQRMMDSLVPVRAIASRPAKADRPWSEEMIDLINQAGNSRSSIDAGITNSKWRDHVCSLASRFTKLVTEFSQGQGRHESPSVDQSAGRRSRVEVKFSPNFSKSHTSENSALKN